MPTQPSSATPSLMSTARSWKFVMYPPGMASPPVLSEVLWKPSKPPKITAFKRTPPQAYRGQGPPPFCSNNRVMRIRQVWEPRDNIDLSQKNSKGTYALWRPLTRIRGIGTRIRFYQNNTGPSNRAQALLGLMPRFWVQFPEWAKGTNSCYMVAFYVVIFMVLEQLGLKDIAS